MGQFLIFEPKKTREKHKDSSLTLKRNLPNGCGHLLKGRIVESLLWRAEASVPHDPSCTAACTWWRRLHWNRDPQSSRVLCFQDSRGTPFQPRITKLTIKMCFVCPPFVANPLSCSKTRADRDKHDSVATKTFRRSRRRKSVASAPPRWQTC